MCEKQSDGELVLGDPNEAQSMVVMMSFDEKVMELVLYLNESIYTFRQACLLPVTSKL